jgi:Mrp family chromosome partitioning ATPase
VLEGDAKLDEALVAVPDTRLMVLPVRAMPTAPSELLASRAMAELVAELHTRFHTVIFDAPPVLGLPDTVTLVDLCDGALFVVGAGRAPRDEVESALERLDASKVLGVVLNRCDDSEVPYASGYGYGSR